MGGRAIFQAPSQFLMLHVEVVIVEHEELSMSMLPCRWRGTRPPGMWGSQRARWRQWTAQPQSTGRL